MYEVNIMTSEWHHFNYIRVSQLDGWMCMHQKDDGWIVTGTFLVACLHSSRIRIDSKQN